MSTRAKSWFAGAIGALTFAWVALTFAQEGPPPGYDIEWNQICTPRTNVCPGLGGAGCFIPTAGGGLNACFECDNPRPYAKCSFSLLDSCVEWQQPITADCGAEYLGTCNFNVTPNVCVHNNLPSGFRCIRYSCW